MRKSRAKYRKGERVASLISLACYLDLCEGSRELPIFYFGSGGVRPLPWAFLQNMQFRVIADAVRNGRLWHAVKREGTQ